MKTLLSLLLVLITVIHGEDRFYDTSYDCTKTTEGSVERRVCTNDGLAKLDKELSDIYSSFYYVTKEIKNDQRAWMKQKNRCKDTVCIQKAYETRITDLNASLNNEKTFPQSFLNVIKFAQTQMEYFIDLELSRALGDESISEKGKAEIRDGIQKDVRFKEDFFRFKNIYFKAPLIAEVKNYNDTRLKKVLGSCYDYHFEQSIIENYTRNTQQELPLYVADGQSIEDLKLSVWTVSAKGKKWFFIYTPPSAYLVNIQLCQQPNIKDNLLQALNSHSQHIWGHGRSMENFTMAMIVNYKNQDCFLSTDNSYSEDRLSINLSGFLSKPTLWNRASDLFEAGHEMLFEKIKK